MKLQVSEAELKSNREDYAKWRRARVGSSDASIIMLQSPWKTPRQLFYEKTGQVKSEFAPSLNAELGIKYESLVRADIEFELDLDFPDQIFQSDVLPWCVTSLDGWNDQHSLILEIKSVLGAQTFDKAKEGKVSEVYKPQIAHQQWVTGAKKTLFYVAKISGSKDQYYISEKVLVEVLPDKAYQEQVIEKCIEFYNQIQNNQPPPLTDRDALELTDESAVGLFEEMKSLKAKGKSINTLKQEAIKKYEDQHTYLICAGVTLKKTNGVWRLYTEG